MNGWRVENLGLIGAVEFSKENMRLTWVDGQWHLGTRAAQRVTTAVAPARSMAEARKIGTAFLVQYEAALTGEDS